MRIRGAFHRGFVLRLAQQGLEIVRSLGPCLIALLAVECLWQTTPARISVEDGALLSAGLTIILLQLAQGLDGQDIRLVLGDRAKEAVKVRSIQLGPDGLGLCRARIHEWIAQGLNCLDDRGAG